jgi:hypothetical protein
LIIYKITKVKLRSKQTKMSENEGWGNTMAGAGVTGAVVALAYGAVKLIRRSRCASHTKCCDFDISRAATERKKNDDLELIVLKILGKRQGPQAVAGKNEEVVKNEDQGKRQGSEPVAVERINYV